MLSSEVHVVEAEVLDVYECVTRTGEEQNSESGTKITARSRETVKGGGGGGV